MSTLRIVSRLAIAWAAIVITASYSPRAAGAEPVKKTPLDDYVAKADTTYEWKVVKTIPGDGVTTFIVDLKSQAWRAVPEVDRAVWQHWLIVVKPDAVKHPTAFLNIGGGRNGSPAPDAASPQSIAMAKTTNSVVAELKMVPNQPLIFNKDGKPRSEDDLLAYGWVKFMETGDPLWIPRLAMVKSAVRAMDTVTALLASEQGGKVDVKTFVVAGGSKRGWTTWLTGAVDKRVVAVVPIVIDVVNVPACSNNHFCAYGFWAPAIGDYTRHKIFDWHGTTEYEALMRIEDPYYYRDRLTMPKFVVNAGGDQYFPPDSSKFYFGDLVGPKYLRYVPNADHSLRGSDAQDSILAFYQAILTKTAMPKFSWEMVKDGSIRVKDGGQADRGQPLAGDEPQGPRLPARDDRPGLQEVGLEAGRGRDLRGQGRQAGNGLDRVLRRAGLRQRRQGAVQVHDAGEHRPRRAAAQDRGGEEAGEEIADCDGAVLVPRRVTAGIDAPCCRWEITSTREDTMLVEAQVTINGSKAAVWAAITDIENAAKTMSGILKIEILEKPASGLVGLKWRETRMLFGKPTGVDKWITDAVENEFYKSKAEDSGFVFVTTMRISESSGGMLLTSAHDSMPQGIVARIKSMPMFLFRGVVKKALLQDLNDIKSAVERK